MLILVTLIVLAPIAFAGWWLQWRIVDKTIDRAVAKDEAREAAGLSPRPVNRRAVTAFYIACIVLVLVLVGLKIHQLRQGS